MQNKHALVLYDKANQQGLPFEMFLRRVETTIPATRQIVLAGLWIVLQKVGQVYGISSQSSEGIRTLAEFVGRLLNVGLALEYGLGPFATRRAVWEFEKEIHTVISQVKPGEYGFSDVFQKVSSTFFAKLVKRSRNYAKELQHQIDFFDSRKNVIPWPAFPGDACYVDELDVDHYKWFVQYLSPEIVVGLMQTDNKVKSFFEVLRIHSLLRSMGKILTTVSIILFFRKMDIHLGTIPPMVYPARVSILEQWVNTQIFLSVGKLPIVREYLTVKEFPKLLKRLKASSVEDVLNLFVDRMQCRSKGITPPKALLDSATERISRFRLWNTLSSPVVERVLIPLSEEQTEFFHREAYGPSHGFLPNNFEAGRLFGE